MSVIYGPDDAIYGSARFGVAKYSIVGPTKLLSGVSGSLVLGSITNSAEASAIADGFQLTHFLGQVSFSANSLFEILGFNLQGTLGEVGVKSINRVTIEGVSGSFNLGLLGVEGGTGFTLATEGLSATLTLGTVKPNLTTFLSSVFLDLSLNPEVTLSAKASTPLNGLDLESFLRDLEVNTVILDFNQFAENFSPKRTVYIPKVA
jgi:hypothetical protein